MKSGMSSFKGLAKWIYHAKRPLIILGSGAVASLAHSTTDVLNFPVLRSWGAINIHVKDSCDIGKFGVTSERIGNYAIKHADLVISVGCRLDTHMAGDFGSFAPNAQIVLVDIDPEELKKPASKKFCMDATTFFSKLLDEIDPKNLPDVRKWLDQIQLLRDLYPIQKTEPYSFISSLCHAINQSEDLFTVVIPDAGQTVTWTFQGWQNTGYKAMIFTALNNSPMGYAVPASVGAATSGIDVDSPIICVTGDGGLQMNLQELQTITGMNLPIKIFVMDNEGYGMIRQTQSDWPGLKNEVATSPPMADLRKVARAFGLKYYKIKDPKNWKKIQKILLSKGPCICRVVLPKDSKIEPKLKFGDPLERQSPYLPAKEEEFINETLKAC